MRRRVDPCRVRDGCAKQSQSGAGWTLEDGDPHLRSDAFMQLRERPARKCAKQSQFRGRW